MLIEEIVHHAKLLMLYLLSEFAYRCHQYNARATPEEIAKHEIREPSLVTQCPNSEY